MGLLDGYVRGHHYLGLLAGLSGGEVVGCYSTGTVVGAHISTDPNPAQVSEYMGGLIGLLFGNTLVSTSYSIASVTGYSAVGGLIGGTAGAGTARIVNSYAAGAVSHTDPAPVDLNDADIGSGGLLGYASAALGRHATTTASYYDSAATGLTRSKRGAAQATAVLQWPTGYTGVYASWNIDLDGDGVDDAPWDFGTAFNYPALGYGGFDTTLQRNDYDVDGDGLIEIASLSQLDAVRHDLGGAGVPASSASSSYAAAFPNAAAGMGCPDTDDAGAEPGPCRGYELAADLDFDTNGDGSTHAAGAGRRVPRRRRGLGSDRCRRHARRRDPLQRRVRRQGPRRGEPVREPRARPRRSVRGAERFGGGDVAGAAGRASARRRFGRRAGGREPGADRRGVVERLGVGDVDGRRPGGGGRAAPRRRWWRSTRRRRWNAPAAIRRRPAAAWRESSARGRAWRPATPPAR